MNSFQVALLECENHEKERISSAVSGKFAKEFFESLSKSNAFPFHKINTPSRDSGIINNQFHGSVKAK